MDKTALVEPEIETGKAVIASLDEAGVPAPALLWFYVPEAEEWRLVIATPLVDSEGPKRAYGEVQKVLTKKGPQIDLRRITVVSPSDPLVKVLRSAIKVGPGVSGV